MAKNKNQDNFDPAFYLLTTEITAAIKRNEDAIGGAPTKPKLLREWRNQQQKLQVEELLDAETKFREDILKYKQSTEVYKKFLQKITLENKNILSARPYFRESAVNFAKNITPAIKASDIDKLKTFDINYQLIKFIKDFWLGPFPKRAGQLFNRVTKARTILIENNMPLAVNRAKLFYRKTPPGHLSLIDMIGICGQGLSSGVDKWCGPYSPVFRSVCIGRMVGNLIEEYGSTILHFYPSDRRILYKAHTIRARQGIEEIHDLTKAVNESFKNDEKEGKSPLKLEVTVGDLSYLMSAASTVSADSTHLSDGEEGGYGVYDFAADPTDLEGEYINRESTSLMLKIASQLPLLHRKVLKLKGVKL